MAGPTNSPISNIQEEPQQILSSNAIPSTISNNYLLGNAVSESITTANPGKLVHYKILANLLPCIHCHIIK